MRDRSPTQVLENGAIRYAVYDEAGNFLRYDWLLPADEPADDGTALSKENLLSDSTEELLFGAAADRTVDGAFRGIGAQLKLIQANAANITLTVQDSNGKGLSEVLVAGLIAEDGSAVYTDSNGVAAGLVAEGNTVISVSGYADLKDYSETLAVNKGTTITHTITLETVNYLKVKSSKSLKFSGNVATVDVSAIGGGAGGSSASKTSAGVGGGDGEGAKQTGIVPAANTLYPAIIGAGGETDANGGQTSFMGVVALGGKIKEGGAGATSSAAGAKGEDGSFYGYESFTSEEVLGGKGGGGAVWGIDASTDSRNKYGGLGGSPGGGSGYNPSYNNGATPGTVNTGGGGAGGDSYLVNENTGTWSYGSGTKGGSGVIAMRIHFKEAA